MREVPDLLGHGDVTVTLNTYAHLMPGQLETSTSALSETHLRKSARSWVPVGCPWSGSFDPRRRPVRRHAPDLDLRGGPCESRSRHLGIKSEGPTIS
jgi:hypothetical protein